MSFKLPQINFSKVSPDFIKGLLKKGAKASSGSEKNTGPTRVLGCDYGVARVVLAEVEKSPEGITLEKFHVIARGEDSSRAPEALKSHIQNDGYSLRKIRTSVRGQSVIVRFVQMPVMTREDLKSAIVYEAENYIPFKTDEVIMDFSILEPKSASNEAMMDVLLVAVKKEQVYPVIADFQSAELEIEVIDIDVLASLNALEYFYADDYKGSIAFLDVDREISNISMVRDGKPRFIRDISYGTADIAKRLRRKLGISMKDALDIIDAPEAASPDAKPVLKEAYETLASDLKVSVDYYLGSDGRPLEKLFLGGGMGNTEIIREVLGQSLGIPVVDINLVDKIKLGPSVDADLFNKNQRLLPVVMGLCLRNN